MLSLSDKTIGIMKTITAYHGTDKTFSELKINQEKRSNGTNGGIWFSSSAVVAESYTKCGAYNEKAYKNALINGDITGESIGNSSIIKVKLNFSNPLIYDAAFNESGDLTNDWNNRTTIADIFNLAIQKGNDGVIINNVDDCGAYVKNENRFSTIYGIISEKQIKY